MYQIENLSADPCQTHTVLTEECDDIHLTLTFYPNISAWSLDIRYQDIRVNGVAVVSGVPLVHDPRLPFTLVAVINEHPDTEPAVLSDFESGRVSLYLLTADEKEVVY